MGQNYTQLSLEERCSIAQLHAAGQSKRQIAAALDRSPSSVSREMNRNGGKKVGYKPSYAHEQAKARRWRGSKLARQPDLRARVLRSLAMGWSPAQIAGRLAREKDSSRISHESIYRFIYAQKRRTDDGAWRHYLRQAKSKRGHRARKSASPVHTIQHRVSLKERSRKARSRKEPGHWEADLMLFKTYSQNVLVAHERSSRFTVFLRQPNKAAQTALATLRSFFANIPKGLRNTIAFDNGNEFALHHELADETGLQTFFCDPHSPWQKGGVENAIGRMRPRAAGKYTLTGSAGRDVFDFNAPGESGKTLELRDVITDFSPGTLASVVDQIDLSSIDAVPGGGDNQFSFITGNFTGVGQVRVIQAGADALVQVNATAAAGVEMTILLQGVTAASVNAGDFIL